MVSKYFRTALQEELPVLFAFIGWTREYNGSEPVVGTHGWLKAHPDENWEAEAFMQGRRTARFGCGIGHGALDCSRLHVVFVSRDPEDGRRKVVGIYAAADVDTNRGYPRASTKAALLFPAGARPVLNRWPGDQGVRRWAWRGGSAGVEHASLRAWFSRFRRQPNVETKRSKQPEEDQTYVDLQALEGASRARLVKHRSREARM
jgi:hypothetical protein